MGFFDRLKSGLSRSREAINEIFYMGGEVDEDFWEDLEDTLVMGDMGGELAMRVADDLRAAPVTSKAVRDYLRVFLSGASDEIPDKQGRVTIPANLREYAGLSRECTVIGAGSRLEVWDTAAWEAYLAGTEQAFADQAEEVIPGLL